MSNKSKSDNSDGSKVKKNKSSKDKRTKIQKVSLDQNLLVEDDPFESDYYAQPFGSASLPVVGDLPRIDICPPQQYASQDQACSNAADTPVPQKNFYIKGKRSNSQNIFNIIFALLVCLAAFVYALGVNYFTEHFLPDTTINGTDVSLLTVSQAESALEKSSLSYSLDISVQGLTMTIYASDIALEVNASEAADSFFDRRDSLVWPMSFFLPRSYEAIFTVSYDEDALADFIDEAVENYNRSAVLPTNAFIEYDDSLMMYVIREDSVGTALDSDLIFAELSSAIGTLVESVELGDEVLLRGEITSSDPDLNLTVQAANALLEVNLDLMLGEDVVVTLDASLVSQWLIIGDDGVVSLDEEALVAWVDESYETYNTYGTTREYTRDDGKEITVTGGTYGWSIDYESFLALVREAVSEGTVGAVEIPLYSSAETYTGVGEQDWGLSYCDIDLTEQYVRFYDENGDLVWESDCITGDYYDSPTPTGVYYITTMLSPTILRGYTDDWEIDYETYVSYWMPFIDNSIGMHDATWQWAFGGTSYIDGYGSHGCVNLPLDAAAELYSLLSVGDVVVVHW